MALKKNKTKEPKRFFHAPKGMHDLLPSEQPYWERIERVVRDAAEVHNFGRIETPILEFADLFRKTEGEGTDIVEKEMYTLRTKGGDFLALRPEYTPAIARAYLEHGLGRLSQPQHLFHFGPVFRHDKPQLGRYRQFAQFGFEVIGGPNDPIYDAQVILIAQRILETLRVKRIVLKVNSIGCKVCRPLYKKQLVSYYKNHEKELCLDCIKRLKVNPLRLLDCKEESCEKLKERAPNILDKLCATCSEHLKGVLEYLDELSISYILDNRLVRGLDYYSRTVFEIYTEGAGNEVGALPAGGRYDYLIEQLGGHLTPAVGFACGVERLVAVLKAQEITMPTRSPRKVFVVHVGKPAKKKSLTLADGLRVAGIATAETLSKESLKAQLKAADREGTPLALIVGQKEIYEGSVIVRDLRNGLQETVPLSRMVEEIKKRLKETREEK